MTSCFALVDCNNFYASCERLFRPDLRGRPIVVLSNNDGCIVARSAEAKALGIRMAVPLFEVQEQLLHENVQVFSSNYALYGDISARVMNILEQMVADIEVYSIDEAFLDLNSIDNASSAEAFGIKIKQRVENWVGISVSVGIAPTKTLAKLANNAAKRYRKTAGVVDLTSAKRQEKLLNITPVKEVWGIGSRLAKQLNNVGIDTALQLARSQPGWIRQQFSISVERTVRELNGLSCIDMESSPPAKKQILCSRTFGVRVADYKDMHAALCKHCERATEKLREQGKQARVVSIFIKTSPFSPNQSYYRDSASCILDTPTHDTRDITQAAIQLLKTIYKEGLLYMKTGVMLADFYEPGTFQATLWDKPSPFRNSTALMQAIDKINKSGKGHICFAGQQRSHGWKMKQEKLSPAYTTQWSDIPSIR
ncbi:translesion error-prone DNA polymerase V subunit UmuC [Neptunomonas japonica]|uniref:translesion error-prone DNA polymerase V subunit UmuC n=1 Tax=Neptunomonas japonica TaxID=417574 RepID=UPI0004189404|nr:translesion error-prone DNA polymerase V subunit UmuC [Neptunomonas japonica]